MEKILLKVPDAAERVSMGKTKFYALVQSGEIHSIRIGRSLRIPADALNEWVAKCVDKGGEDE